MGGLPAGRGSRRVILGEFRPHLTSPLKEEIRNLSDNVLESKVL